MTTIKTTRVTHMLRDYATADHMPARAVCGRQQVPDGAPGLYRALTFAVMSWRDVTCKRCRAARAAKRKE